VQVVTLPKLVQTRLAKLLQVVQCSFRAGGLTFQLPAQIGSLLHAEVAQGTRQFVQKNRLLGRLSLLQLCQQFLALAVHLQAQAGEAFPSEHAQVLVKQGMIQSRLHRYGRR